MTETVDTADPADRSDPDATDRQREAKTWLLVALGSVALLMFVAGFVLVLT